MNTGDPLGKVAAGEPRRITARTWNTFVDAAKQVLQGEYGETADDLTHGALPAVTLLVRNDSGADRSRGHVLRLSASPTDASPLIDYTTIPYDAQRDPLPKGTTPANAEDLIVILAEPIPSTKYGRAVSAGIAVCTVNVVDASHGFARATPADATKLTSDGTGPARILLRQSGTGDRPAIVLLGDFYGYAGELETSGTTRWFGGLLSIIEQVIKGDKEFRDLVTVRKEDADPAYVTIRSGPDPDDVMDGSVAADADISEVRSHADVANPLHLRTVSNTDGSRGTFVYAEGSGFFLGSQLVGGGIPLYHLQLAAGRVGAASYLGVDSLRLGGASLWSTYYANSTTDLYIQPDVTLGPGTHAWAALRSDGMGDYAKWRGIDRNFATGEYPIVVAGLVVGYWSGTGDPPPPPPPIPPVPPVPPIPPYPPPESPPPPPAEESYECVSDGDGGIECVDPGTGVGTYATLMDCEAVCILDYGCHPVTGLCEQYTTGNAGYLIGHYPGDPNCDGECLGDCPEWYEGEGYYCWMMAGCVFVDVENCGDFEGDFLQGGPFESSDCDMMACE